MEARERRREAIGATGCQSKQCHTGSIYFLRPHTYRFGAGRSALREQCLQTVFSAQQRCHLDNFRYFDVFSDNFVISLVFPLYFLCNSLLTVSDTKQSKHKGKTRDMTKLSPKTSKYRKLSRWHCCWAENTVWRHRSRSAERPAPNLYV